MTAVSDYYFNLTDADLVGIARENDRDAYDELVRRHRAACVRFASSRLHDQGEAEEEVQNALWKAFEHLNQFRGDAEFFSWLLRIVANHCLMRLRLRSRARMFYLDGDNLGEGEGQIEVPAPAYDPEYGMIQSQMANVVQQEIRRIPKLLRNVVWLRDVEHLPMPDVADRLGISVPAAKSRLFRARTELRHRILQFCGTGSHLFPQSSVHDIPARSTRCPVTTA
jgi:RNA polymerase sigma-70 factor, ECF subfamily